MHIERPDALNGSSRTAISRRDLLKELGAVAASVSLLDAFGAPAVFAQGRCMLAFGSPACDTTPVKPLFAPTGWRTVALEHITFRVANYRKEAAFYVALMGWIPRSDDGRRAVLDVGDWGSVIFEQGAPAMDVSAGAGAPRSPSQAVVESFGFVIDRWSATQVEAALRERGLTPVADNDRDGFESFHVKDPDGFDLQISNSNGLTKSRRTRPNGRVAEAAPFEATGWKTVWLDHLSYTVANYKESVSFYTNLLGWTPTYDEGSQNECMIGDIGDVIIRGGNPFDPGFGSGGRRATAGRIDHISFGIQPWDTDGMKAELEKRGLRAQIDTSSKHRAPDGTWVPDDIHTAAFKSYHTRTPNGYNLQISYVARASRLALANAVDPRAFSGK